MSDPVVACFIANCIAEHRRALPAVRTAASVRVILVSGAVRGFCAGRDLEDVIDPAAGETGGVGEVREALVEDFNLLIHPMHEGPNAMIRGGCGWKLSSATPDRRIAARAGRNAGARTST